MTSQFTKNEALRYGLYVLAVLPIFIFRDFTLDNELRYLSIADEALSNGSIFTFTNHGIPYADKPPLYLWIVMLGKLIFGNHNMLFLGIFSFVPALVVLYTMDKWVKSFLSDSELLIGQLMLITSGYFIGTALVLRMDMLMCMFIVLSLYIFFRMYSGAGKRWDSILFPFFVFMALFSKGPIGIIIPIVSTTVFLIVKGEIKSIRRYWGWKTLVVLLILCGIWFTGVYAEGGSQYLDNLLFNQTFNRAVDSFHHKEPIYYYLKTIWYSLAPWSLLYAGILIMGIKKKMGTTDLERFFLVVVLSTFATLSLISSKLDVYMLPVFPFVTYLALLWLAKFKWQRWMRPLVGIPACIFCLALPAVIVAQMLTGTIDLLTVMIIFLAASILSLSGIFAIKYLISRNINRAIKTMCVGLLLTIFTLSLTIPPKNAYIGMAELCRQAKEVAIQKGISNYYYCEMSRAKNMDVYLGVKPEMLKMKDLYSTNTPIKKPAILFLWQLAIERNDSLQRFIQEKNKNPVGNYYYIVLE
jgi:4-amino-4-deoxy-L-arabinose transferase-like glycosyltransferase